MKKITWYCSVLLLLIPMAWGVEYELMFPTFEKTSGAPLTGEFKLTAAECEQYAMSVGETFLASGPYETYPHGCIKMGGGVLYNTHVNSNECSDSAGINCIHKAPFERVSGAATDLMTQDECQKYGESKGKWQTDHDWGNMYPMGCWIEIANGNVYFNTATSSTDTCDGTDGCLSFKRGDAYEQTSGAPDLSMTEAECEAYAGSLDPPKTYYGHINGYFGASYPRGCVKYGSAVRYNRDLTTGTCSYAPSSLKCIQKPVIVPMVWEVTSGPPDLSMSEGECEAYAAKQTPDKDLTVLSLNGANPSGCFYHSGIANQNYYYNTGSNIACDTTKQCIQKARVVEVIESGTPDLSMTEGECQAYATASGVTMELVPTGYESYSTTGCYLTTGSSIYYNSGPSSVGCDTTDNICLQKVEYVPCALTGLKDDTVICACIQNAGAPVGSDECVCDSGFYNNGGVCDTWDTCDAGEQNTTTAKPTTIFSNVYAFAALRNDGSVIAWGTSDYGGTAPSELTNVQTIFSTQGAFAALKTDGSVVAWGLEQSGGCNSGSGTTSYSCKPADLTNVQTIFSTDHAFAALKKDTGEVVAWGHSSNGGTAPNVLTNVQTIFSTNSAFAALKTDGSVVVWGDSGNGGTAPSDLTNVTTIVSTMYAFAALKTNGSVVAWGTEWAGGTAPSDLTNLTTIFSTHYAFAALKTDGSVVAWGPEWGGGNATSVDLTNVQTIFSTGGAFAALKTDGSVVAWGLEQSGGCNSGSGTTSYSCKPADLTNVQTIFSTDHAFAALKKDTGEVVAWGDSNWGGTAPSDLTNVQTIFSTDQAFAALKTDGSVQAWGKADYGGTDPGISSGVQTIFSTNSAFAALKDDGSVVVWGSSSNGGTDPGDLAVTVGAPSPTQNRVCEACPVGKYQDQSSFTGTSCTPWMSHTVCQGLENYDGQLGQAYKPGTTTTDAYCVKCDKGYVAPAALDNTDETSCTLCSAGYGGNGTICTQCAVDTYQVHKSLITEPCADKHCPLGQGVTDETEFSNSSHACEGCVQGTYSNSTETGQCTVCDGHKFTADENGTYAEVNATQCLPCPAGTHQSPDGGVCEECPGGQTSIAGSSCAPCSEDTFAADNNNFYTDEPGATQCLQCPAHSINTDGGQCECDANSGWIRNVTESCSGAVCPVCVCNTVTHMFNVYGFYLCTVRCGPNEFYTGTECREKSKCPAGQGTVNYNAGDQMANTVCEPCDNSDGAYEYNAEDDYSPCGNHVGCSNTQKFVYDSDSASMCVDCGTGEISTGLFNNACVCDSGSGWGGKVDDNGVCACEPSTHRQPSSDTCEPTACTCPNGVAAQGAACGTDIEKCTSCTAPYILSDGVCKCQDPFFLLNSTCVLKVPGCMDSTYTTLGNYNAIANYDDGNQCQCATNANRNQCELCTDDVCVCDLGYAVEVGSAKDPGRRRLTEGTCQPVASCTDPLANNYVGVADVPWRDNEAVCEYTVTSTNFDFGDTGETTTDWAAIDFTAAKGKQIKSKKTTVVGKKEDRKMIIRDMFKKTPGTRQFKMPFGQIDTAGTFKRSYGSDKELRMVRGRNVASGQSVDSLPEDTLDAFGLDDPFYVPLVAGEGAKLKTPNNDIIKLYQSDDNTLQVTIGTFECVISEANPTCVAEQISITYGSGTGEEAIHGCMDNHTLISNYDPIAQYDNGTTCAGCTDPTFLNYYAGADVDDGSCIGIPGPACLNPGSNTAGFLAGATWNAGTGTLTVSDLAAFAAGYPSYSVECSDVTKLKITDPAAIPTNQFVNYKQVTVLELLSATTSIGASAFSSLGSLGSGASVLLPSSLVSIGANAFAGSKLTGSIALGASVTVGSGAFHMAAGSNPYFCGSDITSRNAEFTVDGASFDQSTQAPCHATCSPVSHALPWELTCEVTQCVCEHGVAHSGNGCPTDTEGCASCVDGSFVNENGVCKCPSGRHLTGGTCEANVYNPIVQKDDLGTVDDSAWAVVAANCAANEYVHNTGTALQCKACSQSTFKGAYTVDNLSGDTTYRHYKCCSYPSQLVCAKMLSEYQSKCVTDDSCPQ